MSNFVVSARKYRPMRFDEVVGQKHVSQTLKNALQNDHLAHAFLFCGPRGVGKTTCARILAKVLNCQNRTEDYEPCNTCESCTAFNQNASFNITELDAASNNSVEHIRSLVEQVRFQPQQGTYKVFIIDEVHMLSAAAFNAFLKTLEEPPSYAIFILATTEKHKIIPTILSRCQIFDFRRIQVKDIIPHLEAICQEEGIEAEADALHIIAQKADGALRDALSIFDRIVSFSGKQIRYEDVISNLNILDYDYYFKVVDALLESDVSKVVLIFDEILRKGFEADIFINGLAAHLRQLLVCKDEQTLQLLEVSDALKIRYQTQAQAASMAFLLSALSLANDCDIHYKMARNKRLHTEMAMIKIAHIAQAVDLSQQEIGMEVEKKNPKPIALKSPSQSPKVTAAREKVDTSPPKNNKPTNPVSSSKPPSVVNLPTEDIEDAKKELPIVQKEESKPTPSKTSLASRIGKNINSLTPKLSLDAIEEEVNKEDIETQNTAASLTFENLQMVWNAYIETVSSKAVQMTMKDTELQLDGEQITVIIGSKRAEGHIREEYDLMPFLRKKLHSKTITLAYQIDERKSLAHKPLEKPKNLTPKEKFDLMKTQNPLVEEIYKRFEFQLED